VHDAQKTSAAIHVGLDEMARLRERVHGRPVPIEEVLHRLRPYFRRHRVVHGWQRVLDRLPLPRKTYDIVCRQQDIGAATNVGAIPPPRT
jgi:hypothetical protein